MAVISTSAHPKALWPGVHRWWGQTYTREQDYIPLMFEVKESSKAYEEDVGGTGFGLAPVKPEGAAIQYDDHQQQETTRYTHVTYSLGAIVTMEELQDNLYKDRAFRRAEMLAFSMFTTRQIIAANVLNRAFTAAFPGGNGKELIATDQPTAAGIQSNELSPAADLSEAALEDMLIQIRTAKNPRGLQIFLQGQKLIVPPQLEFEAKRILGSTLQSGNANNDINAMKAMGMLPGGVVGNPYLTDPDRFFIKTNATAGLTWFNRMSPDLTQDNDFDTSNAKMKTTGRWSAGWSDWRTLYGSDGA